MKRMQRECLRDPTLLNLLEHMLNVREDTDELPDELAENSHGTHLGNAAKVPTSSGFVVGGAERDRTADLLIANKVGGKFFKGTYKWRLASQRLSAMAASPPASLHHPFRHREIGLSEPWPLGFIPRS